MPSSRGPSITTADIDSYRGLTDDELTASQLKIRQQFPETQNDIIEVPFHECNRSDIPPVAPTEHSESTEPVLDRWALEHGGSTFNGSVLAHENASVQQGNIINITLNNSSATLFGVFQLRPRVENESHSAFRSRKNLAPIIPQQAALYTPYVPINDERVASILQAIAKDFQFLDAGFAEFYRVAVPRNDWVDSRLRKIHDAYRSGPSEGNTYSGALGQFLERCAKEKAKRNWIPSEQFRSEDQRADALICYLQDGFETPYWDLLSERFIQSCDNGEANASYKSFIFHVVSSVLSRSCSRLQRLKREYSFELPSEIEDCIQSRLTVLKTLAASIAPDTGIPEDLYGHLLPRTPKQNKSTNDTAALGSVQAATAVSAGSQEPTDLEKVHSSTLFILFFSLAIIPACIGFARYWGTADDEGAIGLTTDADFMWLIAGNLLALLGNLFAILPLLKLTRGSVKYQLTLAGLWLSVALGIASIASYCFVNKCWSSLMSFFSNFFAISAVYFSTQHIGSQNLAEEEADLAKKVKKE